MDKAQENLQNFGRQLLIKTKMEQDDFKTECNKQEVELNDEVGDSIEKLRVVLERITTIRSISNGIQIDMHNIRERVRTFFMQLNHKYLMQGVDRDIDLIEMMLEVKQIYQRWSDIIDITQEKQAKLEENKKRCSELTCERDKTFVNTSEIFAKEFQKEGPHITNVSIEEGLVR